MDRRTIGRLILILAVLLLPQSSRAQSVRNALTRPWPKYGDTLPSTCLQGDIFILMPMWWTYNCSADGTWTSNQGTLPSPYTSGLELAGATLVSGPLTITAPINEHLPSWQNNSCWVMGDSTSIDTPYTQIPEAGITWALSTRFALDPIYTRPSGDELSPNTWSTQRNATYDSDTKVLTLTTCNGGGCPVNFGIWKADAYQDPISLEAAPTARYVVSFEYDTTGIKNPDIDPTSNLNLSPGSDTVDYLQLYLRTSGTCPTIGGTDADWFNGQAARISFRRAPWTKAAFILDPTAYGLNGIDASTDFIGGACKIEPGFIVVSTYSSAQAVVKIRNFSVQAVTQSTSVRLYGVASQITQGTELDDYPVVKGRFVTGKAYPMNCIIYVGSQNDYDGQGAADGTPSSSTISSFFGSLGTFAATLEADGVTTRLFVPPWQRKRETDATSPWAPNNTTAKSEGWRTFQVALRKYLQQQNTWRWIDPARWWQWDPQHKPQVLGIPGASLPGAGASAEFPVTVQIDSDHGFMYSSQIVSDTAVAQSDTNYYCFRPKNRTSGAYFTAKKKCTRSTGTGTEDAQPLNAFNIFLLSIEQNPGVKPNDMLTLEVNRVGNPTVPAYLMMQYVIDNSVWSENPFMNDGQHPSQLGYSLTADAVWEYLAGRAPDGYR
jgi:hypothetical protein